MHRAALTGRPTVRIRGQAHVFRLSAVFSPITLVVFLFVPLLLLYVVSSERVLEVDFQSRKTLSWTGFAYFGLALLLFAAGAKIGDDSTRARAVDRNTNEELTPERRRSLAVLVEVALVLSILAYVLWFTLGFIRAGGVTEFFEIWRRNPFLLKTEILATVPGVTTLVQLSVAAIPLAIAFGFYRRGSVIRILVPLALAFTVARAFLFSERLALTEVIIPIAFLLLAPRKVTVPRVVVFALVALAATATFFAATELRRSYAYTHDFSAEHATTRFVGYYLTSVNNGMAAIDDFPASTPFYSSGEFLWRLPGLRDFRIEHFPGIETISLRYVDAFGVDPEPFWERTFAQDGLDYEFNVFTGPGFLAADFGWAGLIGVLLLGLISGRLYRRSEQTAFHRAFYAVWLVGLFEFMRILYFSNPRILPAYLVFAAAYVVLRRPAHARTAFPVTRRPVPSGSV